jgi:hypothetical protein
VKLDLSLEWKIQRVYEIRALKRIFEPKRAGTTGGSITLYNKNLQKVLG